MALVISTTLIAGVVAFILPPWYRAEAELLPPSEEDSGFSLASLLRGIAVPGVRVPTAVTPADVFIVVLQSRRVNDQVVKRFDLMKRYKKKYMIDAVRELKHHTSFKLTPAGSIAITVEDRDRQLAADMANAYIEFLDRFNRESRMTKGRRTRVFIGERLAETRQEMQAAEQRLASYQAQNKTVALTPGMSSAIEEAARLVARRTALQVRLGVVQNYSQGSEEEVQIRQELAQLDRQMQALPETGLELARRVRDVKALEQVFALLTAQYEDARITEARDVVSIEVLDVATPPERKAWPKRGLIIAGAFLLSLIAGTGIVVIREDEESRPAMRVVAAE